MNFICFTEWYYGFGRSNHIKLNQPPTAQEEQAQGHVMGHVKAIVHLAKGAFVEEAAQLQHFQVPWTGHDHRNRQEDHAQARLQVILPCLEDMERFLTFFDDIRMEAIDVKRYLPP